MKFEEKIMWDLELKKINSKITPLLAAQRWGRRIHEIKMVNAGVNLVYYFENKNQQYYLRITHANLRPQKKLLAAVTFQDYLFQRNVSVCEPIRSCNGEWIESIQQEDECYLAQVCRAVPGEQINFSQKSDRLYQHWGKTLGELHKAALQYHTERFLYASWSKSLEEMFGYIEQEDH
jgi:Ser/Thr protein kinase RdoA (MazF antagonist)